MEQSYFLILFGIYILHLGENYRTQKAPKDTLDYIKQLITLKAQRYVKNIDASTLADQVVLQKRDPEVRQHQDELSINNPDLYLQGDIDLSKKQAEILSEYFGSGTVLGVKSIESIRRKRKIGREPLFVRWDRARPISYDFAETIPQETRRKIRQAIALWEERTCVRFQESGLNVDRIEFFDGGGCSSFVGRTGGTQGISISTPGCDIVGIISHEIGHVLGIFHEQARPDQNSHIFVNYNNIPLNRWNNFHPLSQFEVNTFNLPYDTGSVMHYGAYGFATDPYEPTITTRDKFRQHTIGQREGPSFLDYAAINIAYHCTQHCAYLHCQHGGYPNPNNCSQCLCPDGFAGRSCENVEFTPCGGLIEVTTKPTIISSPNYPNLFKTGEQCIWLFQAPLGGFVHFQFIDQFELQCEVTCDKSYVELRTTADFRITGYRFCCSKTLDHIFQSVTNEMVVLFRGFGEPRKGFKAKIWSDLDNETGKMVESVGKLPTLTISSLKTSISLATTVSPVQSKKGVANATTAISTTFSASYAKSTHRSKITAGTETTCKCGQWSEWTSPCSQECGGCGKRSRSRQCSLHVQCRTEDKQACNYKVCPHGTTFLINNGEFHILWKPENVDIEGCCIGLFRSGNVCSALDDSGNPFLKILEALLSAQDNRRNRLLFV